MNLNTVFKTFIVIMLFEGCVTSLEPLAISYDFADLNQMMGYKPKTIDSRLLSRQNRLEANAYIAQGVLKMNSIDTNELKLARQLFNASLTYDDTRAEVWNYLGDVSMQESQLNKDTVKNIKSKDAIHYYNQAIVLDSTNNLFYYRRALCYYAMGDTTYFSDYRKSCDLGNAEACKFLKEEF